MRIKKLMAAVMAAAMSLALAAPAFAADANTGSGTAAGSATVRPDPNNVVVVLPTVAKNSLDYIVDPQRVIQATSGAAYASGSSFDASAAANSSIGNRTLYFKTSGTSYTNASPTQTITSKTRNEVTAYIYATVSDNDAVRLANVASGAPAWTTAVPYVDSKNNTTSKNPLIFLKMQEVQAPDGDGLSAIAGTVNETVVKNFGVNQLAINIDANSTLVATYDTKAKTYVYGEPSGFDANDYKKAYFNLTGKARPITADETADATAGVAVQANLAPWAEVTSSTKMPTVSLTWSVVPKTESTHAVAAEQAKTWTWNATAASITAGGAIALVPGTAKVTKVTVSTTGFGIGESATDCTTLANAKKAGFNEDSSNAGQADFTSLQIPAATFSKLKPGQSVYVRVFWDDDTISNIQFVDQYDPLNP